MIKIYEESMANDIISFLQIAFLDDNRVLDLQDRDKDILDIETNYMHNGAFWCCYENNMVVGTIGLRYINEIYEIRRFFVEKNYQNNKLGDTLLKTVIEYAIYHDIEKLFVSTLIRGEKVRHILTKNGFSLVPSYSSISKADLFMELDLTFIPQYQILYKQIKKDYIASLILNPTENIPMYDKDNNLDFLEGLYISDEIRNEDEKVIFGGRYKYLSLMANVKDIWNTYLKSKYVDLKTFSGLHAHMLLFLSIIKPGDTVMLLPENCGGHFSTEKILNKINVEVIHFIADNKKLQIDINKSKEVIKRKQPNYIFVDRSEGLYYEDFSWLSEYKYIYKIFDASQYLTQILLNQYVSPFDMGFDAILTTLHKNYPGPQKALVAFKKIDSVAKLYQDNIKFFISNDHSRDIFYSVHPILQLEKLTLYSNQVMTCIVELEKYLLAMGIPAVKRNDTKISSSHIWIRFNSKTQSYNYYKKLESLGLLTNYRLLPYNLGHGIRIGVNAAVRQGLRVHHIKALSKIMASVYRNDICHQTVIDAKILISEIKK